MTQLTTIEKLLGGEFTSDPRLSRFPLPPIPEGTPKGTSYIHSGFTVTPEMARDWVLHRSIRSEVMPAELRHDQVRPNRKYMVTHFRGIARNLATDPAWWERGIHQGGAFTWDGFLLDAQHRFAASALSGVSIILPIAVGVPWSAWDVIDQGRRRNAGQMIDLPYATACASIARNLIPVLDGDSHIRYKRLGNEYLEQVMEICHGWPYFAEDHSWMSEIFSVSVESGTPVGLLGSVCIGALAGGADPDEVQQFLNGLRPFSDVEYVTIGRKGKDPRRLAALLFKKLRDARGPRGRISTEDERAAAGALRHAMNVWLHRWDERPIEIGVLPKWPEEKDLPPLWNEGYIRSFHKNFVN